MRSDLAALEGTLRRLDPTLDLVASTDAKPSACWERTSPASVRSQVEAELLKLVPLLRRLPRRIGKVTESLGEGRLSVNVRLLADARDPDGLLSLTHQLIVAVLAAAATIGAILLLTAPGGPRLTPALACTHSWVTVCSSSAVSSPSERSSWSSVAHGRPDPRWATVTHRQRG